MKLKKIKPKKKKITGSSMVLRAAFLASLFGASMNAPESPKAVNSSSVISQSVSRKTTRRKGVQKSRNMLFTKAEQNTIKAKAAIRRTRKACGMVMDAMKRDAGYYRVTEGSNKNRFLHLQTEA